jgi:hypothetical protein
LIDVFNGAEMRISYLLLVAGVVGIIGLLQDNGKQSATTTDAKPATSSPSEGRASAPEEPAAKAVAEAARKKAEEDASEAAAVAKAQEEANKYFISATPEDALRFPDPSDGATLLGDIWASREYHVQRIAMQNVAWAEVASSNGRCNPAFRLNSSAVRKSLLAGGHGDESLALDRSRLRRKYETYYQKNLKIFCSFARDQFGPNGKKEHALRSDVGPLIEIASR